MKNNIALVLVLLIFTYSCNTVSEAGKTLRNEKTKTTDEFLVKKRQPLSLPPDYKKLPEPGSKELTEEKSKQTEIDKILKIERENAQKKGSTSVEQSIINEIRK